MGSGNLRSASQACLEANGINDDPCFISNEHAIWKEECLFHAGELSL